MKIAITVSVILIIIGIALSGVSLSMLDFNFKNISTVKYETNTHSITDSIKDININVIDADLYFVKSKEFSVECYENILISHDVTVDNGTLHIKATKSEDAKWYDHISINTESPKITIYLPDEVFSITIKTVSGDIHFSKNTIWENVNIKTTSGDVEFNTLTASELKIKTTSGDIKISDAEIKKSVELSTVSGDIELSDSITEDTINIKTVSGDAELDMCDAASVYVETTSGEVDGKLLTDKTYIVSTNSGNVKVPYNTSGGLCNIKTVSGDVHFK